MNLATKFSAIIAVGGVIGVAACSGPGGLTVDPFAAGSAGPGGSDSSSFSTDTGDGVGWQLTYQQTDAKGHRGLLKTIAFRPGEGLIGEPENGTVGVFHSDGPSQDCYPGWPCRFDSSIKGDPTKLLSLWIDPWSGPLTPSSPQQVPMRTVAGVQSECLAGQVTHRAATICRSVADHFLTYESIAELDGGTETTAIVKAQRGAGVSMFHPEQQTSLYATGARNVAPVVKVGESVQLEGGVTAKVADVRVNSGCTESVKSRARNYIVATVVFHSDPTVKPEDEPHVAMEDFLTLGQSNNMVDVGSDDYSFGCISVPDILHSGYLEPGETRVGHLFFNTNDDAGRVMFKSRPGFQVDFTRQPIPGQ